MSHILGNNYRLSIDMGSGTPTWKTFQDEVTVTLTPTNDKVEVTSKDTGKHKKHIKTLLDHTVSITAIENNAPGLNSLNYNDIYSLYLLNYSDANGGVKSFKLQSTVSGDNLFSFTGFVESPTLPAPNNGLVEYSFNVQVVSLPTIAEVAWHLN